MPLAGRKGKPNLEGSSFFAEDLLPVNFILGWELFLLEGFVVAGAIAVGIILCL